MTNRPHHLRASGIARALTVLVLMAGIVAMHSAVFGTAHAASAHADHATGPTPVTETATGTAQSGPLPVIESTATGEHQPHSESAPQTASARTDTEPTRTNAIQPEHVADMTATRLEHSADSTGTAVSEPAAAPRSAEPTALTAAGVLPVALPSTTAPAEDPHAGPECGTAGCGEHAAVHSCVFVLVALAAAMALVLLYRLTDDLAAIVAAAARPWRGRRERPPPWTVLSLAQLAILRI
ncbi:hypothetical protein [Nocardia neocaledoniensis]|uniref:hypothetical protein n=1 Tax=Nocardia neocaledoniensis TaxID=236511 RepID=UPI0024569A34|nr:hypothetical protein [Nocardia neocaledoniensis]